MAERCEKLSYTEEDCGNFGKNVLERAYLFEPVFCGGFKEVGLCCVLCSVSKQR